MSTRMTRRSLIQALGGVALAAPLLEITAPKVARAAGASKRFFSFYGGMSLGDVPKSAGGRGITQPSTTGTGYEITTALAPLQTYGVKSLVGVVTGLALPTSTAAGGPPGPPPNIFHGYTLYPQVSGMGITGQQPAAGSSSCDQVAGDAFGIADLDRISVQSQVSYLDSSFSGQCLSFKGGSQKAPQKSPQEFFRLLLKGAGGTVTPEVARALSRRQSVLDLVRGGAEGLRGKLGTSDRLKLDEHLSLLRDLEKKVDTLDPSKAVCSGSGDPGADPPIVNNYGNETLRAKTFADLIRMAVACGKVRVASFMTTYSKCHMIASKALPGCPVAGASVPVLDFHALNHDGLRFNTDWVAKAVAWTIDPFARLIAGLRDTTDENGARLIDNTVLTMCFEGGWNRANEEAHSTQNMMVLYAGGVAGMTPKHVSAPGRHPAEAIRTAMTALGITGNLGRFNTTIPGML